MMTQPPRTHDETDPEHAAAEAASGSVSRWAIHRRMYDWVLAFAHHRHANTALFTISFAESSFFPIPPDVLLAPLCLGHRRKSLWFAVITTAGSVLGAFLGYVIGYALLDLALHIPGISRDAIGALAAEFERRGQWYVFVAALTPIPFKLLTVTAGFAEMNLVVFTLACIVGRGLRFFGVAAMFYAIGPRAMPIIDRYFNLLCVVFAILLVGGLIAVKYLH